MILWVFYRLYFTDEQNWTNHEDLSQIKGVYMLENLLRINHNSVKQTLYWDVIIDDSIQKIY